MHCLAAFIVIVVLSSMPSVQSVDCDKDALKMEFTECFTQSGLPGNAGDVQTAIQSNTSHACSNTEAYRLAISCVTDITRTCLITAGLDTALLPDPQKMADGFLYICDHIADYDYECVARKQPSINRCGEQKAENVVFESRDRSIKFITCTVFDETLDCGRQQLGVCARKTKEIFANFFMHSIPTACSGGTSAGGTSCVFLLFAALLAVIIQY